MGAVAAWPWQPCLSSGGGRCWQCPAGAVPAAAYCMPSCLSLVSEGEVHTPHSASPFTALDSRE